jgi:hypothetical protein
MSRSAKQAHALIGERLRRLSGEDILRRLPEAEALGAEPRPPLSLLAGQAVASTIYALLGIGSGPVRDLDVFEDAPCCTNGWRCAPAIHEWRSHPRHDALAEVLSVYGGGMGQFRHRGSYTIASVTNTGLVNRIVIYQDAQHAEGNPDEQLPCPRRIIADFDINAVQVGVDLHTRVLVWTDAFERFLGTRQLQVETAWTPAQTAFRLVHKARDLPWAYVDWDTEIGLLGTLLEGANESSRFSWRFCEPTRRKYGYLLQSHADQETLADGRLLVHRAPRGKKKPAQPLWTLRPTDPCIADWRERIAALPLDESAANKLQKRLQTEPKTFPGNWRTFFGPTRATVRARAVRAAAHPGAPIEPMLARGPVALDRDFAARHLDEINRLRKEHPHLWGRLACWDWPDQLQIVRNLRRAERSFGRWAIGVVEQHRGEMVEWLSAEALARFLDEYIREARAPLVEQPLATRTLGVVTIRELTTKAELLDEGNALQHCVGGYARMVREACTRILSLCDDEGLRSTALIERERGYDGHRWRPWRTVQHSGKQNSGPAQRHQRALALYLLRENARDIGMILRSHPITALGSAGRAVLASIAGAIRKTRIRVVLRVRRRMRAQCRQLDS